MVVSDKNYRVFNWMWIYHAFRKPDRPSEYPPPSAPQPMDARVFFAKNMIL